MIPARHANMFILGRAELVGPAASALDAQAVHAVPCVDGLLGRVFRAGVVGGFGLGVPCAGCLGRGAMDGGVGCGWERLSEGEVWLLDVGAG